VRNSQLPTNFGKLEPEMQVMLGIVFFGVIMSDWKAKLQTVKHELDRENAVEITLPAVFGFKYHGTFDIEPLLNSLDWGIHDCPVSVNFAPCKSANYQALSLLVLYFWRLRARGCRITIVLDDDTTGASAMWRRMGALGLFHVSTDENVQFIGNDFKPLLAIRNTDDFKRALSTAESYTEDFDIEYTNTLRYVLSELLYNTLEHGISHFPHRGIQRRLPSIIQFTWYSTKNEIQFIVADVGVGIKEHLSQTYPDLADDEEALRLAIRPQVSGTFRGSDPYRSKNNAGVGLFISSNIVKRLQAEMYLVSGHGQMHISPRDTTTKMNTSSWPGTFVLVSISVDPSIKFALHSMMQEFRESARAEITKQDESASESRHYLSIDNYFGSHAEDKSAAIKYRTEKLVPAINAGKSILVDFSNVNYAPHSFLSALFATPIRILGIAAYKRIKIVNATPDIRETIDFILDENTDEA
jgi:hypothetical protein